MSSGNWDLEQFYKHLENNFGEDKISKAIEWMDELVVKMLLLLEPSLVTYFSGLTAGGGKQILRYICNLINKVEFFTFCVGFILQCSSPHNDM